MLSAASVAYAAGLPTLGAVLGLLVAALALLAAVTGFCTGCRGVQARCLLRGRPFVSCPHPGNALLTWQFALAGAAVGILVGMTGMGGGSLMTPMLILLFGFDPKAAVGTDILHGAIFKSFGAVHHRQLGNVHAPLALWMLVGSAPLSLVGVQIASSFSDGTQSAMGRVVGAALILGGIGFAIKTFIRGRQSDAPLHAEQARQDRRDPDRRHLRVRRRPDLGRLGHLLRARDAAALPADRPRIVGTDLLHAALLLWVAGAGHLLHGNVDLHAMAWLLVGSIPGVLIGSHLSVRVPERALRIAFAFVLILSGIKLVEVPGATTIIEVGVVLGALALVTWLGLQFRRVRLQPPRTGTRLNRPFSNNPAVDCRG